MILNSNPVGEFDYTWWNGDDTTGGGTITIPDTIIPNITTPYVQPQPSMTAPYTIVVYPGIPEVQEPTVIDLEKTISRPVEKKKPRRLLRPIDDRK